MFSNEIRFGRDPDHSKKRIEELEQTRQKLIEWLETLDASANLMINGIVHLEIKLGNPA